MKVLDFYKYVLDKDFVWGLGTTRIQGFGDFSLTLSFNYVVHNYSSWMLDPPFHKSCTQKSRFEFKRIKLIFCSNAIYVSYLFLVLDYILWFSKQINN